MVFDAIFQWLSDFPWLFCAHISNIKILDFYMLWYLKLAIIRNLPFQKKYMLENCVIINNGEIDNAGWKAKTHFFHSFIGMLPKQIWNHALSSTWRLLSLGYS
jgi:hypothetical protein